MSEVSVAEARLAMVRAFREDGDEPRCFRDTYVANIAMLLYDRFQMTHSKANEAADQILTLAFEG